MVLRAIRTLEFTAIGSGWQVREHISALQDVILAGMAGNTFMESDALRMAVEGYLRARADDSVGGMIPVIKVTGSEVLLLGHRVRARVGTPEEAEIGLIADESGWTQVNVTAGKQRRLLPPWELPDRLPENAPDDRFDDLLDSLS